jgi:predicted Rossmann fold nucleotide-binding protein DprA/Smf involved in DNA uptake
MNDAAERSAALVHALRLTLVPGVGPLLRQRLLAHFGSAEAALAAAPSQLRDVPGIGAKLAQSISKAAVEIDAEGEIELCRREGVTLLAEDDDDFPPRNRACSRQSGWPAAWRERA